MKKFIKSTLAKLKWVAVAALIIVFGYPGGYFVLDSTQPVAEQDNSPKAGVGVYVINLDRSKERYAYVKDNLHALGFPVERVSGIDGVKLSEQEISEKVDLNFYQSFMGHLPKLGMIGSYLSHVKSWQTFLKSNFEYAVIFEDDVSFDAGKLRVAIEDLKKSPELWDMVNLQLIHNGFPLTIKTLGNSEQLVVYLTEVTHAGGYILNRQAAERLVAKAFPMKMPHDHYWTRAWEFDMKFTGIENPRLVHQTFGSSIVDHTQSLSEVTMTPFQYMRRGIYRAQSYAIRFLYNLKVFLTTPST